MSFALAPASSSARASSASSALSSSHDHSDAEDHDDFAATREFTVHPHHDLDDEQDDDDPDPKLVLARAAHDRLWANDDAAGDDDGEGDGGDSVTASPTERFQIEHSSATPDPVAHAESETHRDWIAAHRAQSALHKSAVLTAQDYIPRTLVGITYGDTEKWMVRPVTNHIEEKEQFARVGGNAVWVPRPSSLSFAGFQVGKKYKARLSIVNASAVGQRLHLLPLPLNSVFSFSCPARKGLVAPGMSEDILVCFEPRSYAFEQGEIKIHALGENHLVPLCAFPTLNKEGHVFPSVISMGDCAVGKRVSRRVELRCDIPVSFEFDLSVVNPQSDFMVFPLRGIVPPNGSAWVTIDYAPKRAVSSQLQIRVSISQFDFKPFLCSVDGHAHVQQVDAPVRDRAHERRQAAAKAKQTKQALVANRHARLATTGVRGFTPAASASPAARSSLSSASSMRSAASGWARTQ